MANRVSFSLKPRDQKLMYDMEFLGSQLLRDPNKIAKVINKFAGVDSFLSFFTQYGISTREEGVPGVSNEKIAESLIRWRIKDDTIQATKIVDVSLVPATIYANKPFTIGLSDNWVEADGTFLAEDSSYAFYVRSKKPSVGVGYPYEIEWLTNDNSLTLDRKELLSVGRYLNYFGNGKGELSTTSQPIKMDEGLYDMFNVTQVIRHEIAASGHALSTMTVMQESDANGNLISSSFLPFDGRLLKKHFMYVNSTLYFGRTNFDAYNRKILTTNNARPRPEIPFTSGVKEQMEQTAYVGDYNPYDSSLNLMHQLDSIIAGRSDYFRDPNGTYLIITGNGGTQVLESIKREKLYSDRVNIQLQITPSTSTLGNVGLDTRATTYTTSFGTFKILNTEYLSRPRGWIGESVGYKGGTYDKEGFDMFILPLYKMDDGRRNIRLYAKAKDGINRGLVIGSLPGMSGMYNSTGIDATALDAQNKNLILSAMGDKYKIASATDGEVFLALSEVAAIVEDPDSIYWWRAKFPNA